MTSNKWLEWLLTNNDYHTCACITDRSEDLQVLQLLTHSEAKEKYRGVFEIQKSGDKTSSGEIGLDIRTHASPRVGQDQVSGGVSVPCRHATPVADVLWKPINGEMSDSVKMLNPVMSQTGIMSNRSRVSLVSTSRTNTSPKRDRTRCPEE